MKNQPLDENKYTSTNASNLVHLFPDMTRLFSTHIYSLYVASCCLTLQLIYFEASAQFRRDTVLTMALSVTKARPYPEISMTSPEVFFLNDSFSIARTKKWIDRNALSPKALGATIALGNNYFAEIEELLATHGLPQTYQWIPLSLSGMQYNLYGPDGRAGLWQLPHVIAVCEGLILTSEVDQRIDPSRNSRAAVRYLADLQKAFGDSTYALLAFFNGEGSVRAALKKASAMRFKDEASLMVFIYQHLPSATRDDIFLWNYIASILPDHPPFEQKHPNGLVASSDSVQLETSAHVLSLALLLNLSEQEILACNPSIIGNTIPPGVTIFLPEGKKANLLANIHQLQTQEDSVANKKVTTVERPSAPPEDVFNVMYTVRQGDNLGRIAINHRVTIKQLKEWNNLKGDRINVGQQLVIYTKNPVQQPATDNTSKPAAREPGTYIDYVVKQGDSLWSISRQFPGVTVEDIMRWNNVGERIDIGQVLKIRKQ